MIMDWTKLGKKLFNKNTSIAPLWLFTLFLVLTEIVFQFKICKEEKISICQITDIEIPYLCNFLHDTYSYGTYTNCGLVNSHNNSLTFPLSILY